MLDFVRKLLHLLTPRERHSAILLLMLMGVGAALEMLGVGAIPAFITLLMDPEALRKSPRLAPVVGLLGITTPQRAVLIGSGTLLALFLVKNTYLAILLWLQSKFVFNRQAQLAQRLFQSYLYRPYTFHLERNTAELLRNTHHSAMDVISGGLVPLLLLAMEGFTVAAILLLLLWVEPVTSLTAFLILGGVTAMFVRLIRRRTLYHGEQMQRAHLRMIQTVNEALGGIKVTRVLGRESTFLNAFSRAADAYAVSGRLRHLLMETPRLLLETIGIAGLLVVAGLLVARGRDATALIPTLALLAVAVTRLIPSFNRIASSLGTIRYGRFALSAVYNDLSDASTPFLPNTAPPLSFHKHIALQQVTFQYPGAAEPALSNVSLVIPKGNAVGIIGPTGSGKTTLIDLILGLLEPTAGAILVDEQNLRGHERAWQQQIGYVPQDVYLSDDSIRRNVAFGLEDDVIDDEMVWRAVDAAQVREFVNRLPKGLDTVVGERGVRLSGGQKQRIGIARALYHDPSVLVLDEATSALDYEMERAVMDAVEHLRGRRTIVLIAHRLTTVENCDQLIRLPALCTVQSSRRASNKQIQCLEPKLTQVTIHN